MQFGPAGYDALVGVSLHAVGHSTHEAEEFVELLRGAGIECVVDVRRYPYKSLLAHLLN